MNRAMFLAVVAWIAVLSWAVPESALAVRKRAFVTSVTGTANLSSWADAGGQAGLAAGDNICRARAAAAGLANAATYRAWLSTAATDAYCHVQGLTGTKASSCGGQVLPGGGPWYRMDLLASTWTPDLDTLTGTGRIIHRLVAYSEFGTSLPDTNTSGVWAGTTDAGVVHPNRCSNWTSASSGVNGLAGHAHGSAPAWTAENNYPCNQIKRLLCLEPGASEVSNIAWSPGAIVFATSVYASTDLSSWPAAGGATGLAAGDAICRSLAGAAALPAAETFVAWLSTGAIAAGDRITTNGPFRRVDGYTVAGSKASLLGGAPTNSIHVDELGGHANLSNFVWTGTLANGTPSGFDCEDWTSAASGVVTFGSRSRALGENWTARGTTNCGNNGRLYCFANVVSIFWDGFDLTGNTSRWSTAVP